MGVVYRGRHKVIDKRVAIKILRGEMAADGEMVERFLNEARAASSIGNPHIVDISDFGRLEDGATYFVMEFLDGGSLGDLMTSGNGGCIPVPRLVHIAKQIARGLAAAHARGIVHRDLKPDNIMLVVRGEDRDFAKVLDFGIAKVSSEAGRLTRAGSVFGTPHYMSPEQAAGVPVDQRTDIYSLGVILYEMASGKVPFDADNFMGILTQHMYKSPAPIRAVVPQPQEIPPGLEAIVLKCLSKKVELRYESMEALALDLERVERGIVPEAVQEMMGRSGGFNVPADYFRKVQQPGGAGMLPATPPFRHRKPVLTLVIAGGALFSFLVIAGLITIQALAAPKHAGGAGSASASADPSAAPLASAAAGTAATGDGKIQVRMRLEPPEAIVKDENGNVLPSPVKIRVGKTETVTLTVERKGYVTQTVEVQGAALDAEDPWKVVALVHEKPAIAPAPLVKGNTKPLPVVKGTTSALPPPTAAVPVKPPPSTGACPLGYSRVMGDCIKM